MTGEDIETVQRMWRAALAVGDTFAELFYGKLFSLDPALRPMFKASMKEQGRNLTAMLSVAIGALARPERIALALGELGRRHAAYGVQPAHYETVRAALIWTLQKSFGDAFTPQAKTAWLAAYEFFAATMQDAARKAPLTASTLAGTPGCAARAP